MRSVLPLLAALPALALAAGALAEPAPAASASSAPPIAPAPAASFDERTAPDPPPMVTRHQWVLDLAWEDGAPRVRGARRVELARATATPRLAGRFAVELWIGHELLERYRFDFPLLAADELPGVEKRPWDAPPSFERKLRTRVGLLVPHSERATRAQLVDRATGRTYPLPWPLSEAADAGSPDAARAEPRADAGSPDAPRE